MLQWARSAPRAEGPIRSAPWREAAILPRFAVFLLMLCLLLAPACRRGPQSPPDLQVDLEVAPLKTGPAVADLSLSRGGAPAAGARVEMEANMNHAGMVPVLAPFQETSPGAYRADFRFTMGGDWFVEVRGTLADGTPFQKVVQVPAVEP